MGTVNPRELLRLYTLGKITLEQAMGYALQNLVMLYQTLETIDRMKIDIERMKAFMGMEETKGKKQREDDNESED